MSVVFINSFLEGGVVGDPMQVDQANVYAIIGQSKVRVSGEQANVYAIIGQSKVRMSGEQANIYVIVEIP